MASPVSCGVSEGKEVSISSVSLTTSVSCDVPGTMESHEVGFAPSVLCRVCNCGCQGGFLVHSSSHCQNRLRF